MIKDVKARDQYADDLGGFHHFVQDITEAIFKINGRVSPLVVAEAKERCVPAMFCCPDGNVNRFFSSMQDLLEEQDIDRVAKIGEACVSEYRKDNIPQLRPSLDPNRKEMVVVVARERGGGGLSSTACIIRPVSAPPYLASWESVQTNNGPLLGMVSKQ
jgi:hypothetical protein